MSIRLPSQAHLFCVFGLCVILEVAFEWAIQHKVLTASVDDEHLYRLFNLLTEQLPFLKTCFDAMPVPLQDILRTLVSMFDILEYTAVMRNRVLSDGYA